MKTIDVKVGSPDWHAHRATSFNASDAPAMLGVSPYKSRTELLRERATGVAREVDGATQARFDDGHKWEALARPLAEEIIGEELYAVVGVEGRLSASFDGLTLGESTAFEHKSINDAIRAAKCAADLPEYLRVQMEQQLYVSKATRNLFMASKWDANDELVEEVHHWYEPDLALRQRIIAGWQQFEKDLADYVPAEVVPEVVAAPQTALPAVFVQVSGGVSVRDNLTAFGDALKVYVERINRKPETDQDFADLEATVKTLKTAEEALDAAESGALAQTESIDLMRRMVAEYRDLARANRLIAEKVVKAEKENRRNLIVQKGKDVFAAHVAALNARLGKSYMPIVPADFAGAVKGLKTMSSIQNAVDTELARAKIAANEVGDRIQANLATLRELALEHAFLFADAAQVVLKAADDCTSLVKLRIAEHQASEDKKAEELRVKIAEEERVKAEAKTKADQDARTAEENAIAARQEAVLAAAQVQREADRAPADLPAARPFHGGGMSSPERAAPAAVALTAPTTPTLTLGKIAARLGFSLTADFLRSIGFEPAGRERAAMLYHESDWPAMCTALIAQINRASEPEQQAA